MMKEINVTCLICNEKFCYFNVKFDKIQDFCCSECETNNKSLLNFYVKLIKRNGITNLFSLIKTKYINN